MRTKVTLTLLLLNVALFFWIFWIEIPTRIDPTLGDAVLQPRQTAVIDRLEIRRAGTTPITLEKRKGQWFLAAPYDWPANTKAVEKIVDELRLLRHRTKFSIAATEKTTGQKLADFGLENPAVTLAFGGPNQMHELKIGTTTHVENSIYVLPPDSGDIHVIDRGLVDALPAGGGALRTDRVIETNLVVEARALVVHTAVSPTASERVRVAFNGSRWQIESPIDARADKSRVELALRQLDALRVSSFLEAREADLRATGLENPAIKVAIDGNQRRQVLMLGGQVAAPADAATTATTSTPRPASDSSTTAPATTTYYAKLEDRTEVFTVALDQTLLETLRGAQRELRDHRVLDLGDTALKAVELKAPGQPDVVLQKLETGAWQVQSRNGAELSRAQPADPARVDRLLKQLVELEATSFPSDAPSAAELENWGFNLPERAISLTLADNHTIGLNLGAARREDSRRYARTSSSLSVYLIRNDILDELPVSALAWRARTLRELPSGARITGLALKRLAGPVVFEQQLASADEKWETPRANERPEARAAVVALLPQLRTLRAKEFIRDRVDDRLQIGGETVLWAYELVATIELAAGEQVQRSTSTLLFSERIGGTTMYVGSSEFDCVFLAPQELLDAVFALTFGERDPGAAAPTAP